MNIHRFTAIRGKQGKHTYYTCTLTLPELLAVLPPLDKTASPEKSAQRPLNDTRAYALSDYLGKNDNYTLPPITISARNIVFAPNPADPRLGTITVIVDDALAVLCNDGQHRRRAIEIALTAYPHLVTDSVSVVFYEDSDLRSMQQRFADLNSAQPAARSVKLLYDLRRPSKARDAVAQAPFAGFVEMQAANASPQSDKLWTLSGLDKTPNIDKTEFWTELLGAWPALADIRDGKVTAKDVRKRFIWAHNVALQGIGFLAGQVPGEMIAAVDWSRANPEWENRAQAGKKMLPAKRNAILIANMLLKKLELPLPPAFQQMESAFETAAATVTRTPIVRVLDEKRSPVVVSYGAGVNGDAMLWWAIKNGLRIDAITFADTGGEIHETYAHLEYFNRVLVAAGYPMITRVRKGGNRRTLEEDCLAKGMMPSLAYGMKGCSQKFKREPQEQWANNWAPAIDAWQLGYFVQKWIGYDADEEHRGKVPSDEKYSYRYPLVELGWGRDECIEYIKAQGGIVPPKSSCFFCPARKKPEIVALSIKHPELIRRALAMEAGAREGKNANKNVKGLGRSFSWGEFLASKPNVADSSEDESGIAIPCECYVSA